MTDRYAAPLLLVGKAISKFVQWASLVAGILLILLIPVLVLLDQGKLPGIQEPDRSSALAASPLSTITIFVLLALIMAGFFHFFGRLGALIASAGEGDPFTPENADRLEVMAWLFVAVKILAILVGLLRLHVANLANPGLPGGDSLNFSPYDLDAVVIVLVLFILARIFRQGSAMRDDLQGTV